MIVKLDDGSRFSRRALLRRAGAGSLLAPFVPVLLADEARAAAPPRLLLVLHGNGTAPRYHLARVVNGGLDFSQVGGVPDGARFNCLAPLSPFGKQVTLVQGLNMNRGGGSSPHDLGFPAAWTGTQGGGGFAKGPSVDQVAADRLKPPTRFRTLELGVFSTRDGRGHHPSTRMIYRAAGQPVVAQDDPTATFDRIFAGVSSAAPGAASRPGEADAIRLERRSVIDGVARELRRIEATVGADDRAKLQAHLQSLRELEGQLAGGAVAAGCAPVRPAQRLDPRADANVPQLVKLTNDLVVMAFRCDLTRIASLQWTASYGSQLRFGWIEGIRNSGGGREPITALTYHGWSHKGDDNECNGAIYRFWAEGFADLLGKLQRVSEGERTLLDETHVVWGSDMGAGGHKASEIPYVVAGGGNRYFKLGRIVQASGQHNRLLVSILHSLGLTDVTSFGNGDGGPVPGLT
jgi:hypothetical protein